MTIVIQCTPTTCVFAIIAASAQHRHRTASVSRSRCVASRRFLKNGVRCHRSQRGTNNRCTIYHSSFAGRPLAFRRPLLTLSYKLWKKRCAPPVPIIILPQTRTQITHFTDQIAASLMYGRARESEVRQASANRYDRAYSTAPPLRG